jgi:hypothetical protein
MPTTLQVCNQLCAAAADRSRLSTQHRALPWHAGRAPSMSALTAAAASRRQLRSRALPGPGMIPPWKSQGTDAHHRQEREGTVVLAAWQVVMMHIASSCPQPPSVGHGARHAPYTCRGHAFSYQDIKDATVHYRSDNHNHYHAMPLSAWFRLPVDVRLPNPGRTRMRQIKDEHFSRLRWLPAGEDAHIWIQFSIARGAISILKARPQLHRLEVSLVIV